MIISMELEKKIENHIKEKLDESASLIKIDYLGEGVHGKAYRVIFTVSGEEKQLIMKTLFPSRFGHDHFADRAQVLLLANANFNEMPKHVNTVDVVGDSGDELVSIKDAGELYIYGRGRGGFIFP